MTLSLISIANLGGARSPACKEASLWWPLKVFAGSFQRFAWQTGSFKNGNGLCEFTCVSSLKAFLNIVCRLQTVEILEVHAYNGEKPPQVYAEAVQAKATASTSSHSSSSDSEFAILMKKDLFKVSMNNFAQKLVQSTIRRFQNQAWVKS